MRGSDLLGRILFYLWSELGKSCEQFVKKSKKGTSEPSSMRVTCVKLDKGDKEAGWRLGRSSHDMILGKRCDTGGYTRKYHPATYLMVM